MFEVLLFVFILLTSHKQRSSARNLQMT